MDTLQRTLNKISEANMALESICQYSPNKNQIGEYISSMEYIIEKYRRMEKLMEIAEDITESEEEADEVVYEAAKSVIGSVKSFYNNINKYESYRDAMKGH